MTTTLHLLRHGSHDRLGRVLCGRMDGVTLGDPGLAEVERVAARLGAERIAAVWTSPLERCRQTAEPVAARLGLTAEVDPDLNEVDFGAWSGLTFDQLHGDPMWAVWNQARQVARPPGGETLLEAQARALRAVERARAAHPDGAVVLATHADIVKALACWALGLAVDAHARLTVDPASLTTVHVGDWGVKLHSLNETTAA